MPSANPEANAVAERFRAAVQQHLPPELKAESDPRPWGEEFDAAVIDTTLKENRILLERK